MKNRKTNLVLCICMVSMIIITLFSFEIVDASEESWAIYWYLCGSDLESDYGAATADLMELLEVDLPENVTVVIETGGAYSWQNETVEAGYLERYVYTQEGFWCAAQEESASMGDAGTLSDFLKFCHDNYPADHEAVIFWDHGGGSVQGAVFDEMYDYDSLTLDEFHEAFAQVYDLSEQNPPLELVGFDACLMATIDTAGRFTDVARYLVASEEMEPGCGWNYSGWMGALASDTAMDGSRLGTVICDSYLEGCIEEGVGDEVTLSLINLSLVPNLIEMYERIGQEAIEHQYEDAAFYMEFSRAAMQAENYGGNTDSSGYANLVDLGDLIRQNSHNLPQYSEELLNALESCVLYKINGSYKRESSGLSCYFSYNSDEEELEQYAMQCVSSSFIEFYEYCLTGEVTESFQEYLESGNYTIADLEEVPVFEFADMDEIPVYIDENGYAAIELDENTVNALIGVNFQLAYMDEEDDIAIWLGSDNDLDVDWENGIFRDNFRDVWGAIDGHLCYMEIVYEGEDYNLYLVPVLLNGTEYQLHVVYDYLENKYEILGARRGLDDNGMSDRNLVKLRPGDQLTTLLYVSDISGDDEFELFEAEEFEVTEDTGFAEEDLGDGNFAMMFQLTDCRGNDLWSDVAVFNVEDGYIYVEE